MLHLAGESFIFLVINHFTRLLGSFDYQLRVRGVLAEHVVSAAVERAEESL
jgi:hypothetical protein